MVLALTVGRECHSWHGVHAGLSDVFEVHRDVPERHTLTVSTHSKAGATPSPTCTRRLLLVCTLLNGTYHSHTRRLLSSDVLTNRRFSSTKVMVLTAPR